MADQPKGNKEPVPSSKEVVQKPVTAPTDKPVDKPAPQELSPEVSARTKEQFEKLKTKLAEKERELEEERKKAAAPNVPSEFGKSVLDLGSKDPMIPPMQQTIPQQYQPYPYYQQPPPPTPYLNPQQVQGIKQGYIDENGNIDIQAFNAALSRSNAQAQQAFRAAQQADARARKAAEDLARFEENQQVKILHEKFPELDPVKKESFDPNFFRLVKSQIHEDMIQGRATRDPDYAARVAQEVKQYYKSPKEKTEEEIKQKEAVEKYKETQEARNQGPFETGKGEERSVEDYKSLRKRTRAGDARALDERLNAFLNKKE